MECPNCKQPVEPGAAFCGNCGYKLNASTAQPMVAQPVQPGQPAYAVPAPVPAPKSDNKALLSVLFGTAGIIGSIFMALIGLVLGIAGLVLGSVARSRSRKGLSTAGILLSALSLMAGLAVWIYVINHDPKLKGAKASASSPAIAADNLSTPCYTLKFPDRLNVENAVGSCNMKAYNGSTMDASTEAYKVYANKSSLTSTDNFTQLAKSAVENDIKSNLSGYTIKSEKVGSFAASPDFVAVATDESSGVTVTEGAVYHQVSDGSNIFILVHALSSGPASFSDLEAQWQWK